MAAVALPIDFRASRFSAGSAVSLHITSRKQVKKLDEAKSHFAHVDLSPDSVVLGSVCPKLVSDNGSDKFSVAIHRVFI
jgi:hypothetical protein